ncbi:MULTISPECIES: hypothetical protein [unclassified Bradyrhizobium]|uniref:hypothetical protein n=1 Tax=unclassified Bradyrhizobium TaxID=2631580 RepID=UPI0028EC9332|nr:MULTISPECIES: hypothetical protein [unclassified Bradyrhizobium]
MLKKMSVALLAASILAAPAVAAGRAKTDVSPKSGQAQTQTQTAPNTQLTTDTANAGAAKTGGVNSTVAKSQANPTKVTRQHRAHRHYAHRHHKKVNAMRASMKVHGAPKAKVGFNKTSHKAMPKVSFRPVSPTARRG